jgi:ParB/RepB/Spo0J family partition protein
MAKKPPLRKRTVQLEKLTIEYAAISDIQPNEYNPNRMSEHDFELLCRSMREDGFTQPVIVHRDTKRIVDGEHRWRAGAAIGLTEIPVVYVDMTPEQMRIATLRHNRARGSEDMQLSAEVLRDLEKLGALDWAADSLMLSDAEIEKLLKDVSAPDALAGDQYTDAWAPQRRSEAQPDSIGVAASNQTDGGGGVVVTNAMSIQAVEAQRQQEKRMGEAHTEEERAMVRRDRVFYRINLVFADTEAEMVKGTLGDKPAERLLELCRQAAAAEPLAA